jgi:hypothetical protein
VELLHAQAFDARAAGDDQAGRAADGGDPDRLLHVEALDGDDRRGQFLRTGERLHVEALVIDQARRGDAQAADDRRHGDPGRRD